jgi:hypothetical protein
LDGPGGFSTFHFWAFAKNVRRVKTERKKNFFIAAYRNGKTKSKDLIH